MRLFAALFVLTLPWKLVTLDNGLQLLMQPDPSMPHVGVEYFIRGGSREEAPGQHGVAHLFEHNVPSSGRFSRNTENRALANRTIRGSGAGTQPDFLRFYLYTTPEGIEATLAQLADRLESDPERFTAENLKRDQDIVANELRRAFVIDWDVDVMEHLNRGTYGADHPYGHATSGKESDVRAATVETMRDWHRRFAGASNAVVLVVGNFDPAKVEPMVRRHFGSIPPGTRAPRLAEAVPSARARRDVIEKDVPKTITYMRWPIPGWGTADGDYLTLLAHMLKGANLELLEAAGSFTVKDDRAQLDRILRDGVSAAELEKAKSAQQTDFVQMLERGVWRGSRADALGLGLLYRGDPDAYREQLTRTANATPAQVTEAARRWLGKPGYVLQVVPRPKRSADAPYDRTLTVAAGEQVPLAFPKVEETTLPNGLKVLLIRRGSLPLAQITAGYSDGSVVSKAALSADVDRALRELPAPEKREPAPSEVALARVLGEETSQESAGIELLVISGDVEKIPAAAAKLNVAKSGTVKPSTPPAREKFILIDTPAAPQTTVLLAQVLPSAGVAADLVTHALRSRLMSNLRSNKGWSYEVYPFGVEHRGGRAVVRFTIPLQSDKTAEAIAEVRKEIARLHDEPVSADALGTFKSYVEGSLTSGLMSLAQLNAQALELARNGLPYDTPAKSLARLQSFTAEELQAAARELLRPEQMIWIVSGKREEVERELRELGVPFELHEAR